MVEVGETVTKNLYPVVLSSLVQADISLQKRAGARTQPCWTPGVVGKQSPVCIAFFLIAQSHVSETLPVYRPCFNKVWSQIFLFLESMCLLLMPSSLLEDSILHSGLLTVTEQHQSE